MFKVGSIADVEAAVWAYLNALHDGDVEGLARAFPPKQFTDFLSLVRTDAGWRIVAKTYHATDV